jgi:hypothetical protein
MSDLAKKHFQRAPKWIVETNCLTSSERFLRRAGDSFSGEHRLLACSFRQPAEKLSGNSWAKCHYTRWAVVGKLPTTTGYQPVLPRSRTRATTIHCSCQSAHPAGKIPARHNGQDACGTTAYGRGAGVGRGRGVGRTLGPGMY